MNDLLKKNRVEQIEGTIVGFRASWDSGIAHLVVDGVDVPCNNAATVRCLDACFDNFIIDGPSFQYRNNNNSYNVLFIMKKVKLHV